MAADYGRGGGYDYQWLLSFYLYTFFKENGYSLSSSSTGRWKSFMSFKRKMFDFKDKCIEKYGDEFTLKVEVLVEWEEQCLEDITFLSTNESEVSDNNIFIQVKSKWWKDSWTISTSNGIYKAVKNFLHNVNFQRDKNKGNISFFIFTNKDLTRPLTKNLKNKPISLYIDFSNYIIWKWGNASYPSAKIDLLQSKINTELIVNILTDANMYEAEFLKIYDREYISKLSCLIKDLEIVFDNLIVITKIDHEILESELETFYWETLFLREHRRIQKLCWEWIDIKRGDTGFERYEKYRYTYFSPQWWGKYIHEIDCISRGKFI